MQIGPAQRFHWYLLASAAAAAVGLIAVRTARLPEPLAYVSEHFLLAGFLFATLAVGWPAAGRYQRIMAALAWGMWVPVVFGARSSLTVRIDYLVPRTRYGELAPSSVLAQSAIEHPWACSFALASLLVAVTPHHFGLSRLAVFWIDALAVVAWPLEVAARIEGTVLPWLAQPGVYLAQYVIRQATSSFAALALVAASVIAIRSRTNSTHVLRLPVLLLSLLGPTLCWWAATSAAVTQTLDTLRRIATPH